MALPRRPNKGRLCPTVRLLSTTETTPPPTARQARAEDAKPASRRRTGLSRGSLHCPPAAGYWSPRRWPSTLSGQPGTNDDATSPTEGRPTSPRSRSATVRYFRGRQSIHAPYKKKRKERRKIAVRLLLPPLERGTVHREPSWTGKSFQVLRKDFVASGWDGFFISIGSPYNETLL